MKTAMELALARIEMLYIEKDSIHWEMFKNDCMEKEKEQIGQFMNWFIKHYSTATIDGMFGWVNSMNKEVTLNEILEEYYNQTYNNGTK